MYAGLAVVKRMTSPNNHVFWCELPLARGDVHTTRCLMLLHGAYANDDLSYGANDLANFLEDHFPSAAVETTQIPRLSQ
jgi:hypothetical protein